MTVDLGGRTAQTWGYNGRLPGPEVRVRAGEVLRATLSNRLPQPTTVHWHGIALRNDMDGVPDITQPSVTPGAQMVYEFAVPDPGTYMFHSHVGLQLDRGLYAPLIVEDPAEPLRYDREFVVLLDDWTDGVADSPDTIMSRLQGGAMSGNGSGNMPGMPGMPPAPSPSAMPGMPGMAGDSAMPGMAGMPSASSGTPGSTSAPASVLLGGDAGDVTYPYHLINGRGPQDPAVFDAKPGEVVRVRIVNPGSDTAYRVALGGHRLTVTHTDGFPIRPVQTDALLVGMGERYDVLVTVGDGAFPLVAVAEGKTGQAFGIVRTASGTAPAASVRPAELDRKVLTVADTQATDDVFLAPIRTDRTHRLILGGDMATYRWTINGRTFDRFQPLPVREGERVSLTFDNQTTMFHPMHLHGHTFQVRSGPAGRGARKDTLMVNPGQRLTVDLVADNPGQWLVHCHNSYHLEGGMGTTLSYVA